MRRLAPLLLVAHVASARADGQRIEPETAYRVAPPPSVLPHDKVRDGSIIAVGTLLYLLSTTLLDDPLSPDACRWCDPPDFDAGARDALRWEDPDLPRQLSSWVGYAAVPAVSLGLLAATADHRREWLVDAMIVVESAVLTANLTRLVKISFGRERPWIHALPEDEKDLVSRRTENNVAFVSGHTSFAFSCATAAGVIASRRGYRGAPVIWGVGLALAATTGYLRVAADQHWVSDVIAGAALGAAGGTLVPRLLHASKRLAADPAHPIARLVPTLGGVALVGTF